MRWLAVVYHEVQRLQPHSYTRQRMVRALKLTTILITAILENCANIPTTLLPINMATKMGNKRLARTFIVNIRMNGPINATLTAYTH